jgi:murein DD-endopeptidase MepM/ murein hydrolase activator NlpD
VVELIGNFYLAGRAIYINHGGGLVTAYFHLSRAYVKEGDTVAAGQRIGAVGKSGRVTGPHLHWVARYGAVSADPMSLLQLVKSKR